MRAIVVEGRMEPGDVSVSETAEPVVLPGTIEVEIRAAGCNFSDILMLRGEYQVRPDPPFILGREAAGVVTKVAQDVTCFQKGDRVLAATGLGAFAERVVVPAAIAYPMPEAMTFEAGAALPIVYPTSYAALVDRAALVAGETLLVHAAAGGVGLAAVQIGKALGAKVIATAGGADKLRIARAAGADFAIDYRSEDFVAEVQSLTEGRGADVIYDSVGGDTFDRSLKCIAWKGRLLVIGFASGRIPEVAANRIMLKNIALIGLHWPAYAEHQPHEVDEVFARLFGLHAAGQIEPLIHASHPLEEAGKALRELAERRTVGKVILAPG